MTSQRREKNGVPIDKRMIAQMLKSAKTANLHTVERDEGIRKLIKDYYLESLSNTDQNLIQMDIASSEEEDEQDDATTTTRTWQKSQLLESYISTLPWTDRRRLRPSKSEFVPLNMDELENGESF